MEKIKRSDIPKLYKNAMGLQQSDPKSAFEIYRTILALDPKLAEAYFQIGNIHMGRHAYKQAVAAFKNAADLKPAEAVIWRELVKATLALGDPAERKLVRKHLLSAKLPPNVTKPLAQQLTNTKANTKILLNKDEKASLDRAVSLMGKGQFAQAAVLCTETLKQYPTNAALYLILATAQDNLNQSQAEENFKNAIKHRKNYAEAYSGYGRFLHGHKRYSEALEQFGHALSLAPEMPSTIALKALTLSEIDKPAEALIAAKQAHELEPKNPQTSLSLAMVLEKQGKHEEALTHLQFCIENGMQLAFIYQHIGVCLLELKKYDAAKEQFLLALDKDPNFPNAHYRLGVLDQRLGDFDDAAEHFRTAIRLDPTNGEYYMGLTSIQKLEKDDPIIDAIKANFDDASQPDETRRHLGFALAKIMEDTKQYDQVFTYLKPANDLMLAQYPFDMADRHKFIAEMKRDFTGFDIDTMAQHGHPDAAPVFVTGMPRSGTTLVEQIIASHSRVGGAGEVGVGSEKCLDQIRKLSKQGKLAKDIQPQDQLHLGREIAETLAAIIPESEVITDKSITTYTVMPMIKAAIPNSKVIVVRRDPRDNLLSIYKNQFLEGTHNYAYDLKTLAQYYKTFVDLIDHWRDQYPDAFYEVHYEALIDNPEEEARKLIDAAGLDWEDGCLNFHQNKREVKTLSVYQVRQPIYKSSLKGWQRYAAELKPMLDELELE